jgi:all-trans-nonaprenyl-diphosphate synthase
MLQVVASLLYADSGTHVEKRSDFEAFLLVSYEGIELSAEDKPCNLLNGCASFKFKLSQLSSKSDKRLFCIKFEIPEVKANYPFLETVTNQIRCISRNRDSVSSMKRIRLGEEKVSESKVDNPISLSYVLFCFVSISHLLLFCIVVALELDCEWKWYEYGMEASEPRRR